MLATGHRVLVRVAAIAVDQGGLTLHGSDQCVGGTRTMAGSFVYQYIQDYSGGGHSILVRGRGSCAWVEVLWLFSY